MNLVVIESPYAGEVERNLAYARIAMRHSFDCGEAPFASHLLYTQPTVLDDTIPKERQRGIQAGYEWMEHCDLVAFYVDHGWSPGMLMALKITKLLHKPTQTRLILTPSIFLSRVYYDGVVPEGVPV